VETGTTDVLGYVHELREEALRCHANFASTVKVNALEAAAWYAWEVLLVEGSRKIMALLYEPEEDF
jgi:hypothetical protein